MRPKPSSPQLSNAVKERIRELMSKQHKMRNDDVTTKKTSKI